MMADAARAARPGGLFVCISHGGPADRLPLLTAGGRWALEAHTELAKGRATIHVYLLRRTAGSSESAA